MLPGQRILSLPEAICRAGAGSVLAPLWPVDDEVGRVFAARFQDYCRDLPRDLALQRTQCDFLSGAAKVVRPTSDPPAAVPVAHPFFWAGYRLHGDGGRLRWPRPGTNR